MVRSPGICSHGRRVTGPTPILGDNQAMYDLVHKHGATVRTRYFERATLLVKRAVMLLIVAPYLIATDMMVADIFTKPLEKATYVRLRDVMMNSRAPLLQSLQSSVGLLHGKSLSLCKMLIDRVAPKHYY